MGRSRLPLVALLGAVGCTSQEAPAPGEGPSTHTTAREEEHKGGSVRPLSPEERRNLFPQAATGEPQAAAEEPTDAVDYAEQRRLRYEQRMRTPREDAARRDAGLGLTPEEAAADRALAVGPVPEDLAGQRRQQLARERLFEERFRKYGKGGGIKRTEIVILRDTDGGTHAQVKD